MVGFDCERKKIFEHSSDCGSECRSDGISVQYTRTAKGVLRFGGSFSIGFQPKQLSATCTCLQPLRDCADLMTNNCEGIKNPIFLDVCFAIRIEPANFTEIFRRV